MRRLSKIGDWRAYTSCIATSRVCIGRSVTPAMEAGIADYVWTIEEIVRLA